MTTTLVLRFPRGSSAAASWTWLGGAPGVEIPPSPWRLLRTLHATWRTRVPGLDDTAVRGLLGNLAVPPRFFVPQHLPGACVDRDPELAAQWTGDLPPEQHAALTSLASAIPYVGRAESRCAGSVPTSWAPAAHECWEPLDVAEAVPAGVAVTSVLAAELPLDLAALVAPPVDVRRGVPPIPAGARLVAYQRCVMPRRRSGPVTAVRLEIMGGALPAATETVFVTDLLRRAALSRLGALRGEKGRTLLGGRGADERVAHEQHAHTHFLPVIEAGRVAAIVAWISAGLPDDELKALVSIRELSSNRRSIPRLAIRAVSSGSPADVAPDLAALARTWTSATPYTPARYPKRHTDWLTFLREDVTRELGYRRLPAPVRLDVVDRSWQEWRRLRPSADRSSPQGRAPRRSAFLRLHFDEPVDGPLALGHLSHFGLGLFVSAG